MTMDPIQRFLGVSGTTDALRLLGLNPADQLDAAQVQVALERQLARVYHHSEGQSAEAEQVRQRLRAAAGELRRSVVSGRLGKPAPGTTFAAAAAPRTAATSRIQLTTFDRTVLAVLVACGGWNAQCRARLVALASAHGVSVQGLIRVLTGLAAYARAGGPRLDAQEIGSSTLVERPSTDDSVDQSPVTPALISLLAERLAEELRREGRWPTIKLSIIFGTVTLIVAALAMRWLVVSSRPPVAQAPAITPPTLPSDAGAVSTRPAVPSSNQPQINVRRVLTFRRMPTFLGNGLPVVAAVAADQSPQHIAALDEVARKLSITTEPSESVYRAWEDAVQSVATGWVLIDASTRRAAAAKINEAMIAAAASPEVLDRLFRALTPPPSPAQHPAEPVDLWRGAWRAGTLGRLAASTFVPPVVIDQARNHIGVVFREPAQTQGFVDDATRWLDGAVQSLISGMPSNERTYDEWELWIGAQRALGGGPRWHAALMLAIEKLMQSTADLSDPGPAQNVLGRLVALAMDDPAAVVRDRMLGFFDDTSISIDDLWVLTSLMAQDSKARWFESQLVVPPDADELHRARVRDSIARVWPEPAPSAAGLDAGPIVADKALAERWTGIANAVLQQPRAANDEDLVRQILMTSRLVEAMDDLAAQDFKHAGEVLDAIDRELTGEHQARAVASPAGGLRRGQTLGVDGQWSAEYAQLGRNAEDRLQSLRALRNNAGTDLGEIDSRTLVHEAYRGATQDVRTMAQGIVAEQFVTGLNVAMQLLDQFPGAPQTEGISDMIQRVAGGELPSSGVPIWPIEARLALVLHALDLRPEARSGMDQLVDALTDSFLHRLAAVQRDVAPAVAPRSPAEAGELLVQAWRERAQVTLASNPVPTDLGGIQQRLDVRMELAEGPIQRFVAHQLGVLDLLAYIAVAQQPALRDSVVLLISESMQRRARLHSVLEQSLEVERTIVMLWKLRLQPQNVADEVPLTAGEVL